MRLVSYKKFIGFIEFIEFLEFYNTRNHVNPKNFINFVKCNQLTRFSFTAEGEICGKD